MTSIDTLRADAEQAEQDAQNLMAEKDAAIQKVRDEYTQKLQDANDKAAAAQKAVCDAEALETLVNERDAAVAGADTNEGRLRERQKYAKLADELGLTLPE